MENQWLAYVKRLEAIASTGLFFGESDFDKERYEEIHAIAMDMMASLGKVPIKQLNGLIDDSGTGYVTPKIDVRAAIIQSNEILLVQEELDGLWTLPGGYADLGISGADNIIKEVWEEASIEVKTTKLYGVFHKAKHHYDQDIRDFYKMFFLCEQVGDSLPAPGMETKAVGYFNPNKLPPLSKGRIIEEHIQLAFRHMNDQKLPTDFD